MGMGSGSVVFKATANSTGTDVGQIRASPEAGASAGLVINTPFNLTFDHAASDGAEIGASLKAGAWDWPMVADSVGN
jgi:hypothetical protein